MTTLSTAFSSTSSSPAIIIPHTDTTYSYTALSSQIHTFQSFLATVGLQPQSAVSISLPNSLEFIVSFLATANQRGIAAPLNAAYTQAEFEFYIDDIKSALVIVSRGAVGRGEAVVKAARTYNAGIAEVWVEDGVVQVELVEKGRLGVKSVGLSEGREDDVALVLHTSGTTGRPKAVRPGYSPSDVYEEVC